MGSTSGPVSHRCSSGSQQSSARLDGESLSKSRHRGSIRLSLCVQSCPIPVALCMQLFAIPNALNLVPWLCEGGARQLKGALQACVLSAATRTRPEQLIAINHPCLTLPMHLTRFSASQTRGYKHGSRPHPVQSCTSWRPVALTKHRA